MINLESLNVEEMILNAPSGTELKITRGFGMGDMIVRVEIGKER